MAIILGIDTGGTYTDSVIVESESKTIICKAKALTTKEDLTTGIRNSIEKLCFDDLARVSFVSLSTTLATNAIVENKRCKAGLILVGKAPEGEIPADLVSIAKGRMDIKGHIHEEIDRKEILSIIESLRGRVGAIAVSGYASIRNPKHEIEIKNLIREQLNIPVVCAHELTSKLGFYERTVTCVLNAGLIPIIAELVEATKAVLKESSVEAPIMIVKGDGSLMREQVALDKPIETLLSGPAASITGGSYLTGLKDGFILDMGGTTTDIANLTDSHVQIRDDGAVVGGWTTYIRAAEISTYGIGGDSHLWIDSDGELQVGPKKAMPLCAAASRYPSLIREFHQYSGSRGCGPDGHRDSDYYLFLKRIPCRQYSEAEEQIMRLLKEEPHGALWLSEKLKTSFDQMLFDQLTDDGTLMRISLTPTDILHSEGSLAHYDEAISSLAVGIMADRCGRSKEEFIPFAKSAILEKLTQAILQSTCQAGEQRAEGIRASFSKPIVAIGAPVSAWIPEAAGMVGADIVIPKHSEVANAVGAAMGRVMEIIQVLVRFDAAFDEYVIFAPTERIVCREMAKAKERAREMAVLLAGSAAEKAGSSNYEIVLKEEDRYNDHFTTGTKKYVETVVSAMAIGSPTWC